MAHGDDAEPDRFDAQDEKDMQRNCAFAALAEQERELQAQTRRQAEEERVCEDENWQAYQHFRALSGQWKVLSTGGDPPIIWVGLDYTGVRQYIDLMTDSKEEARALFSDIQLLEAGAMHAHLKLPISDLEDLTIG